MLWNILNGNLICSTTATLWLLSFKVQYFQNEQLQYRIGLRLQSFRILFLWFYGLEQDLSLHFLVNFNKVLGLFTACEEKEMLCYNIKCEEIIYREKLVRT